MNDIRNLWLSTMIRIADPVLSNAALGTLKINMPFTEINENSIKRREFMYLEAFARTLCGMASWLELSGEDEIENKLKIKYNSYAIKGLENITDPLNSDYINFQSGSQNLVDAAYLAQGLLRAPNMIWGKLKNDTKKRIIVAFESTRRYKPSNTNWLLFASIIEVALLKFSGKCNFKRMNKGISLFIKKYYVGDGLYGDGINFHMDYYNSYVIHPMLTDALLNLSENARKYQKWLLLHQKRQSRLCQILERLIAPDGTYPIFGRTISCRFGAFHSLAQSVYLNSLPDNLIYVQVKNALTSVLKKHLTSKSLFDANGWLTIGLYGQQISLAENYISDGSPYHCMNFFLPLGLASTHPFWLKDDAINWSNKAIWAGSDYCLDHAYDEQRLLKLNYLKKVLLIIIKKVKIG